MATTKLTRRLLGLSDAPLSSISNEEREALMSACEKAKMAAENQLEAAVRFMLEICAVCLRAVSLPNLPSTSHFSTTYDHVLEKYLGLSECLYMKLLDLGTKAGGPIAADQLALASGQTFCSLVSSQGAYVSMLGGTQGELTVQVRIMRMLVGMGIFEEVGHQTYLAKPVANIWTIGSALREAVIHMCVPAITRIDFL